MSYYLSKNASEKLMQATGDSNAAVFVTVENTKRENAKSSFRKVAKCKMPKRIFLLCAFLVFATVTGCKDDSNEPKLIDKTTMQFDSLKGEWSWFNTFGGFAGGTWDNEFKSIIRILSQNKDSSINYEVIVEDTLFIKSSFKIHNEADGIMKCDIKLPHFPCSDCIKTWNLTLGNFGSNLTNKDTLTIFDGCMDSYYYRYLRHK